MVASPVFSPACRVRPCPPAGVASSGVICFLASPHWLRSGLGLSLWGVREERLGELFPLRVSQLGQGPLQGRETVVFGVKLGALPRQCSAGTYGCFSVFV